MNDIDQNRITTAEAMKLTGYTQEYIRKLTRDGKVESEKFGKTIMISKESLLKYYNRQQSKQEQ